MRIATARQAVDEFAKKNAPCCAGCDWWRYHNSVIGECIKSVPVSGHERLFMTGIELVSGNLGAGHIFTRREHSCGDFSDTHNEEGEA